MARSTLEAVFGALGAGLQGYGADKNLRMNREEERLRREEEARRAADQQRIQLFQSGLEVAAPLEQRAKTLGQSGALAGAAPSVPGMASSGLLGRALAQAGRDMGTDLTRGRRLNLGGVDYVQPFSRTTAGREEREQGVQARQAQLEQATRAAELETQFGRQKELIQLQGSEARRLATTPRPATGTGGGRADRDGGRGVLPTVSGAIADLKRLSPRDIQTLSPVGVSGAANAPRMMSEARGPYELAMGIPSSAFFNSLASPKDQRYALHSQAIADAVARANEVGVLSNQDNDRYARQVRLIPNDADDIKQMKVRNLIAWAEWLSNAQSRIAAGESPDAIKEGATELANQLDERMNQASEVSAFRAWQARNEQRHGETDQDYVARFRSSGGR